MQLIIFQVFCCFLESLLINYLFYARVGTRPSARLRPFVSILVITCIVSLLNINNVNIYIKLIFVWSTLTLMTYYAYNCSGRLYRAIFWASVYLVIATTSDVVTFTVADKIIGSQLENLNSNSINHYVFIYLIVTALIVWIVGAINQKDTYMPLSASIFWAIFIFVGVISTQSILKIAILIKANEVTFDYPKLLILFSYSILIVMVALIVSFERLAVYLRKSKDLEMHKRLSSIEKEHYTTIVSVIESLAEWKHDYKGQLSLISYLIEQEKCIELKNFVKDIDCVLPNSIYLLTTGNSTVDSVVSLRLNKARNHKIKFTHKAFLPSKIPLTDVLFASLITNILDNAIEACCKIPERNPEIYFEIIPVRQMLKIYCNNTSDGSYEVDKQGILLTTKDEEFHGIGTSRIKKIVDGVGGVYQFIPQDSSFTVVVLLPLEVDSFENSNSGE